MDVFERINILEKHENEKSKKEMMKLIRRAVTKINNIKLNKLRVELEIHFEILHTYFSLTIYKHNHTNKTFSFYNFRKPKRNNEDFDKVIELIKKDNFKIILNSIVCQ